MGHMQPQASSGTTSATAVIAASLDQCDSGRYEVSKQAKSTAFVLVSISAVVASMIDSRTQLKNACIVFVGTLALIGLHKY
jgi:hypothetical protein